MKGLAITPDGKTLVGVMQAPLEQDLNKTIRIVTIDIASGASPETVKLRTINMQAGRAGVMPACPDGDSAPGGAPGSRYCASCPARMLCRKSLPAMAKRTRALSVASSTPAAPAACTSAA